MIKRIYIYYKERYPIIPRIILGIILFLEIHFIILLNMGVTWLRVADDLKDFETDKKLFPDRPLPSGRVLKKDIIISCSIVQAIAIGLNIAFMRENLIFLAILYFYGFLMSKWFFKKKKIQPSLPLALITHNPVQAFINLYIIAFTFISRHLSGRYQERSGRRRTRRNTRLIRSSSVTRIPRSSCLSLRSWTSSRTSSSYGISIRSPLES